MTPGEAADFLGCRLNQPFEEVRRIYLRRLKSCRPETDPEGFQRLREAWESWQAFNPLPPPVPSPLPPTADADADAFLEASRLPLGPEQRTVLLDQLAGTSDPRWLEAGMNVLLVGYDPWRVPEHDPLADAVSEGLTGLSLDSPLILKWTLLEQLFRARQKLSDIAIDAIKTVLLYDAPLPPEQAARLQALGSLKDHTLVRLWQLDPPTLAQYLEVRQDLKPVMGTPLTQRLKQEDRVSYWKRLGSRSEFWWGVVLAGVFLLFTAVFALRPSGGAYLLERYQYERFVDVNNRDVLEKWPRSRVQKLRNGLDSYTQEVMNDRYQDLPAGTGPDRRQYWLDQLAMDKAYLDDYLEGRAPDNP